MVYWEVFSEATFARDWKEQDCACREKLSCKAVAIATGCSNPLGSSETSMAFQNCPKLCLSCIKPVIDCNLSLRRVLNLGKQLHAAEGNAWPCTLHKLSADNIPGNWWSAVVLKRHLDNTPQYPVHSYCPPQKKKNMTVKCVSIQTCFWIHMYIYFHTQMYM